MPCSDMLIDSLDIDARTFADGTGWEIKPEGACKGEVCVPLPEGFDLPSTAERLGMAIVPDESSGRWAVGPASVSGRALVTATAPQFELEDLDGNSVSLPIADTKTVLVAWAPY